MLDAYERFVLMYDLTLRTARVETEMPAFREVADAMLSRIRAKQATLVLRPYSGYRGEAPWLRIKDGKKIVRDGEEYLALLFSVGDPRAANPVFEHADTAVLREIEKEEREGKAVSAHCVISLEPVKFGRHRVIVEDIRGLGKTRLRDILGSELKAVSETYGLSRTNNAGEETATYIIPDLEGYASEKIEASLKRGTLSGVWLVDTNSKAVLDEVPEAKIARREIKIDVAAASMIPKITVWGRERNFDKMRLVWNDPEGTGRPERASVDITQQDVAETSFVKQRKVTLEKPLAEAVEQLRPDMLTKMINLK
ncbi:hypothetical protein [Qipengyuania atrilutea]|uniref:Uncharacterized protein n=1 Tax=Qipengyuania atrilutea TaxID=2744473 RepID=A0A850H0L0_9SPHN|nr:hypothetical protein [Actirhodobacter atriluteus]NVD44060.1 hypothetical protein [Actirhodobacter atriluteus]